MAESFFVKLQAGKRLRQWCFFLQILQILAEDIFYRTPWVIASGNEVEVKKISCQFEVSQSVL